MRVTVRVPATSANLGPGFDCFGLALDLCNEVTVDTEAEPGVTWEGEGADELPTDGSDLVSRAILGSAEEHGLALPSLALRGTNRIPPERGLGSSSAAAVAGASIGAVLAGVPSSDAAEAGLDVAADLEGHADNAAAAVFGGLILVAAGTVHRLQPHPSLRPVALVPRERSATSDARRALPDAVGRDDAVFNIAHAALAAIALTQRPELLREALHDRLHEEARAALMPASAILLKELRASRVPACLSGAGPSLLAFESEDAEIPRDLPDGWRAIRPGIRSQGIEFEIEG
jgi:homoserine kinase